MLSNHFPKFIVFRKLTSEKVSEEKINSLYFKKRFFKTPIKYLKLTIYCFYKHVD